MSAPADLIIAAIATAIGINHLKPKGKGKK